MAKKIDFELNNLRKVFPENFTEAQIAKGQTLFLKELAYVAHKFYSGKVMTVPKAGVYSFNWFNVWYTPGVSKISTSIRDDNNESFELTNRGNLVAVVSDSTRVLGDGDVTPSGGLGVMEGKAFLMKYLGGVDAVALCVNSYNKKESMTPIRSPILSGWSSPASVPSTSRISPSRTASRSSMFCVKNAISPCGMTTHRGRPA